MDSEEKLVKKLEGFITAQRAFLLGLPALFQAIQHPEKYPNLDLAFMFKDAWGGAWDCNHKLAELLGLNPMNGQEIADTAINQAILEQEIEKGDDLERLASLE